MPYLHVGRENTGELRLYYEDHGAGQPIVLIHGWPLSGQSWEKQVPMFLDAGYRVITYDRRGFGESSKPTFGYDYDTLARDLDQLLSQLDLHEVTLVGFSMGGGEVARYLGTYGSERVTRAVFISAVPPYLLKAKDNPEGVESTVFEGIQREIIKDRPAFLSQFLSNFYNKDRLLGDRISEEAIRANWNIAVKASPQGTLDCVNAWLTDFRSDLAKISVPTLVIHGDTDRIVPLQSSGARMYQMIAGSKLVTLKDAPHGLIWTHASEVNEELTRFLSQTARRPRKAG